jgi:hypothetical protein
MGWRRRFFLEFVGSLALYACLLVASISVQVVLEPTAPARFALAAFPMIGCVAVLVVVMRAVRHLDELERRIQFEGIAFAFAATALVTFGWGFMETAGAPHLPAFWVWGIMAACWCVGTIGATRRYR